MALPITPEEQERALLDSKRIGDALGEPLLGAFVAVRRADAAWAAGHTPGGNGGSPPLALLGRPSMIKGWGR